MEMLAVGTSPVSCCSSDVPGSDWNMDLLLNQSCQVCMFQS